MPIATSSVHDTIVVRTFPLPCIQNQDKNYPGRDITRSTFNSKLQQMGLDRPKPRRSSASAAAFGRLRLDSPIKTERNSRRNKSSNQRSLQSDSAFNNEQGLTASLRRTMVPSLTEKSPLLAGDRPMSSAELSDRGSYVEKIPPSWWIVPALVCAACYALYNICIKLGSSSIHPILGGVVLQFVAATLGSIMLLIIIWKDGPDDLHYDSDGIKWAVCAGVAVGAAEILSFIVSGLGVEASRSIPIIIGGSVGIGCVLGVVILNEMLGVQGWFGVGMIICGVALVGTDPSGAGAVH